MELLGPETLQFRLEPLRAKGSLELKFAFFFFGGLRVPEMRRRCTPASWTAASPGQSFWEKTCGGFLGSPKFGFGGWFGLRVEGFAALRR